MFAPFALTFQPPLPLSLPLSLSSLLSYSSDSTTASKLPKDALQSYTQVGLLQSQHHTFHVPIHTRLHTRMPAHTYTHAHTYIHTYAHACIHTYTHTCNTHMQSILDSSYHRECQLVEGEFPRDVAKHEISEILGLQILRSHFFKILTVHSFPVRFLQVSCTVCVR